MPSPVNTGFVARTMPIHDDGVLFPRGVRPPEAVVNPVQSIPTPEPFVPAPAPSIPPPPAIPPAPAPEPVPQPKIPGAPVPPPSDPGQVRTPRPPASTGPIADPVPASAPGTPAPGMSPYPTSTPSTLPPAPNAQRAATTTRDVNGNELVANQLAGMIERNNPLLMAAQGRANALMAQRGMSNSSMANEAAQSAVIQNALPIAQQDAATYSQAARDNMAATNAQAQFNAGEQNKFGLTQQSGLIDIEKIKSEGDVRKQIQWIESNANVLTKQIERDFQLLMRASASASDIYRQMQQNISNIVMNKDLDAGAKDAAIKQQIELTRGGFGAVGSLGGDVDLVKMLDSILRNPGAPSPGLPPPPTTTPYYPPPDIGQPSPGGGTGGGH